MILSTWIFLMLCFCFEVMGQTTKPLNKNRSMWKPQRINSKFLNEFQTRVIQNRRMLPWIQYLRKIQKKNDITEESNEITDEFHPKIVNGREAKEAEFPWMVALHYNGRFVCSSFLISPTIVMTAAHCVQFQNGVEPASAFYGIVGNIRREGPETRVDFSEVAAHPEYGTGSENDIAVLRTSKPVTMSEKIQPVCLPTAGREIEMTYIQAMGWGATSSDTGSPQAPEVLMTTELQIVPKGACQFLFAIMAITITDKHICANSYRATGVCFGDSGGPAIYNDPSSGRPVAVGVASFITFLGCGRPLVPSVYTRTASYMDWLEKTVRDSSGICKI